MKVKQWIYDNQHQMELMARNISKSDKWVDLRSETLLAFSKAKSVPDDIIDNNKYFYYVYGIMRRTYISNSVKFQELYSLRSEDIEEIEDTKEDEVYDPSEDERLQLIYHTLRKLINDKDVKLYDAQCFILYYLPQYSPFWVNISMEDYLDLNKKTSWRKIESITGINYQSLRNSSLLVLNKIKNRI